MRFFLWIFIGLLLALGAGVYLKFQGKNEGQAAQTIGVAHTEALTGTALGLVGYWTLDGNDTKWSDSETEIKDTSGSAKHGDAQGALATGSVRPGRVGQGILFNGSSDLVSLGNVYNGVKTVALWVKPNSTTQSLIDLNATATVDINAGTVRGNNFTTPTVYVDGAATATFPDTNWHHIAITTATGINANAVNLGKIASSYFDGILDDIRFYSTALTAMQVTDLYLASSAKEVGNANHREALTNGLVGYWTFDGRDVKWSDTGTEVKDISGNNNHGATSRLATSSVVPGKLGQGLFFRGDIQEDKVTISHSANIDPDDLTVAVWVKRNGAQSDYAEVLVKGASITGDTSSPVWSYALEWEAGGVDIKWAINDNTASENALSATVPNDIWTHLVGTYTNGTKTSILYMNGTQRGSPLVLSGTRTKKNDALTLGHYLSTYGGQFAGSLDDVRVYNRTLSASEVMNLYNSGK